METVKSIGADFESKLKERDQQIDELNKRLEQVESESSYIVDSLQEGLEKYGEKSTMNWIKGWLRNERLKEGSNKKK